VQTPLEDITKMIRKTEVRKDELKERSDAQIQRGAQSFCIYEPYHGRGAWPFLHVENNTLYRGLSLVSSSVESLAVLVNQHLSARHYEEGSEYYLLT